MPSSLHRDRRNSLSQVTRRLGPWHVWTTLGRPHGLHFYLDLTDPEQKDVAKIVVKLGIKASTAVKTAAKAAGGASSALHKLNVYRGQHLLNLRCNGQGPLAICEDDNMWSMIENSYQTVEFDFAPSPVQMEARRVRSALSIQRLWRAAQEAMTLNDPHERGGLEVEERERDSVLNLSSL